MDHESVLNAGTVISQGCDWITATAWGESGRRSFAEFADVLVGEERNAARSELAASKFGFKGWRGEHWFYGVSAQMACVTLSGPRSSLGAYELIGLADNVSRIDYQVTYAYDHCRTDLARQAFHVLESGVTCPGRPFGFTLIDTKPEGQTLTINRRISDAYGRLYDKGAESGLCCAGRLWRAEVEYKRALANRFAMAGLKHGSLDSFANGCVRSFYDRKGLKLGWNEMTDDLAGQTNLIGVKRDSLAWFRDTVSITAARLIKVHGLDQVLKALKIDHLVHAN